MALSSKVTSFFNSSPFLANVLSSIFATLLIELFKYVESNRDNIELSVVALQEVLTGAITTWFVVSCIIVVIQIGGWMLNKRELAALSTHAGLNIYLKNFGEDDEREIQKSLIDSLSGVRTIKILAATGFNTFGDQKSFLYEAVEKCPGLVSIIMLSPHEENEASLQRSKALSVYNDDYRREIINTITVLKELRSKGKNIELRFYNHLPLWKLYVTDDEAWVQHYNPNAHVSTTPIYGFKKNNKGQCNFYDFFSDVFDRKSLRLEKVDLDVFDPSNV